MPDLWTRRRPQIFGKLRGRSFPHSPHDGWNAQLAPATSRIVVADRAPTLSDALGTLSGDFTQLAQLAGDSFGGPLRVMGETIKAVEMVAKGIGQIGDAMDAVTRSGFNASNLTSLASGWTSVATAAFQYYNAIQSIIEKGKIEGAARSLNFMADELATAFGKTTQFSDALNQSLRDGDTVASHLTDILGELGGVSNLTAEQLRAVEGVIGGIIVNGQRTWQEVQQLDAGLVALGETAVNSGSFVSQFFLDAVKYAEEYGVELEGVNEVIAGQLGEAASGLNDLLGGLQASATAKAQAAGQAAIHALKGQIEGSSGSVKGALEQQLKAAEAAQAKLVGTFSVTEAQGAGLAAAVLGDFAAMVEHGATFGKALDALQPSIGALSAALSASGVDGGAAFGLLTDMSRVAKDAITGPLTDALAGADRALKGLHNSGILNQSMFTGLELTAVQAYNKIIEGGGSAATANMLIAPTLQDLWSLQKDFGYAVDDTTQALIDQAVEDGRVGDKHRPIAEQMLIATQKIVTAMELLAVRMGVTLPDQAAAGAWKVNAELGKIKTPVIAPPWAAWGPPPAITSPGAGAENYAATSSSSAASAAARVAARVVGRSSILPFVSRGTVATVLSTGRSGGSDLSALQGEVRGLRADLKHQQRDMPRAIGVAVAAAVQLNRKAS